MEMSFKWEVHYLAMSLVEFVNDYCVEFKAKQEVDGDYIIMVTNASRQAVINANKYNEELDWENCKLENQSPCRLIYNNNKISAASQLRSLQNEK